MGESEAKLREVFEEAARHAPSILFIDEIDAGGAESARKSNRPKWKKRKSALWRSC